MIEEVRNYIAKCPHLEELKQILINYLDDGAKSCSINEESSYNPIISEYINGYKECQFKFNLDCKFIWNEDLKNNIENSKIFENFARWLEENDENKNYPEINEVTISSISANSNGYIFMTNSNEAIYRINCIMNYGRF